MAKTRKLLTFVSIIRDARIRALVSSRERNEVSGFGASATGNFELVAAWVELSTRVLVCSMQRQDLVADEVVAWRDALWDCVANRPASLLNSVRAPHVRGTLSTLFLDLKPDSTGRALVANMT